MNRVWHMFVMSVTLLLVGMVGGCAKNPEPVLRERAQAFTQLLTADRFEEAVEYFDPDVVARSGRVALTEAFKSIMNAGKRVNEATGRQAAGFEIRTINFYADKTQASVHLVFFTTDANGTDRREFPTEQKWVLKKAIWYATQ